MILNKTPVKINRITSLNFICSHSYYKPSFRSGHYLYCSARYCYSNLGYSYHQLSSFFLNSSSKARQAFLAELALVINKLFFQNQP